MRYQHKKVIFEARWDGILGGSKETDLIQEGGLMSGGSMSWWTPLGRRMPAGKSTELEGEGPREYVEVEI